MFVDTLSASQSPKHGKLIITYEAPRPHGLAVDTDGAVYASGASRMTVMKIMKKK